MIHVVRVAETIEQTYERAVPAPPEARVVLHDVDWATYEALRSRVESPGLRLTYCEGELEIMTPGPEHEDTKTKIARLLELWALERDVPLRGHGSTTFKKELARRGLEPDECYVLGGELREVPDLAIEVVVTSGGLDKLAVYADLGVPEVWFWKDGAFQVRVLAGTAYEARDRSALLPQLDLEELASFCRTADQHAALKAYRDALRAT